MFEIAFFKPKSKKPHPKRDSLRELAETIVFVVVLVLMLKLFVVEAFVIPTGSMAETLYGYHKEIVCEQCGYPFDVNASCEVEASQGRQRVPVAGYCCPNCRFTGKLPVHNIGDNRSPYYYSDPSPTSGDRVLVHKVMGPDERGAIVVFKFPVDPQLAQTAQNYIKRCIAFGGETVAIHRGELFFTKKLEYPPSQFLHPSNPKDLWMKEYSQYGENVQATELFDANKKAGFPEGSGGFELFRKPDDLVMAMRRVVYNNDYQPKDVNAVGLPARWQTLGEGWDPSATPYAKVFRHTGANVGTLRYQHRWLKTKTDNAGGNTSFQRDVTDEESLKPKRITNFMGYNAGATGLSFTNPFYITETNDDNDHWVGDLMLECTAKVESADAVVVLDLARGPNRYQAEFAGGKVKLIRTGPGGKVLAERPATLTPGKATELRFANIDCRLRVWIDGKRIDFGTEADYPYETMAEPDAADSWNEGYTVKNDILEPASIRVQGSAEFSKLVIWRDSFYTGVVPGRTQTDFLYVPVGHYLCFGDNSSQSSDSRSWGTVPERLMLGRAVFTFFPFNRFGFIR